MMTEDFRFLEAIVKRAPLGLRFRDMTYGVDVTNGLQVMAVEFGTVRPIIPATHSPVSGIYGFHRLRGLRPYQDNEKPATDWCQPNSPPNWVISVTDTLERFLPQVLPMCLPKTELFPVELYSSPARIPKAGYAVIRGEIWDEPASQPASWALISATEPLGKEYVGVADGRGMFVLFMPYPKPSAGTALSDQLWPLAIRVLYQPTAQRWSGQVDPVPASGESVAAAKRRIPPDTNTLINQLDAGIFEANNSGTTVNTLTRSLRYRADLVLTTQLVTRLWVESA